MKAKQGDATATLLNKKEEEIVLIVVLLDPTTPSHGA